MKELITKYYLVIFFSNSIIHIIHNFNGSHGFNKRFKCHIYRFIILMLHLLICVEAHSRTHDYSN